jgi:hypothetical protein
MRIGASVIALVLGATLRLAAAQSSITAADIQRLQDNVFEASRDIAQAQARDPALASRLQAELDNARDEVVYLRVKLRKNEPIAQSEYTDLRGTIESIRSRARGETPGRYGTSSSSSRTNTSPPSPSTSLDVPVGSEFDVRLQSTLSSETAQVEDRVEATTMVDFVQNDRVIVPAGSVMRGIVESVTKAGRIERKGSLTLVFNQFTINGTTYPIHATVVDAIESEGIKGEVGKIGAGAGVGAIIGGIIGGAKGALAGILIGGGGTIAATEGKDVELAPGTVLRVRLDSGLALR